MSYFKLLILPGLLAMPFSVSAASQAYVNAYTPMLSAPSEKSGKPIKNLAYNEQVRIVYTEDTMDAAEGQAWVRIHAADGREGYVRESALSPQKLPEPEFQVEFRDIEKKVYVAADALYLRAGPTRSAPEKGMLVRNSEVTILEYSDNDDFIDGQSAKWARVRAGDDLEGWLFSAYLSEEPRPQASTPSGQPQEDPNHIMSGSSKKVRPPFLGVRDEPSKYGTVIGRVRQGKSVTILERLQNWENAGGVRSVWVKIRADGIEGWVYGGFLSTAGYTMSSDSLDKPFILPLDPGAYRRTCNYGPRTHPTLGRPDFHTGVDLGAGAGTPIYAAGDGVVELTNDNTGYGLLTIIRHENGLVTYYAHQSRRRKNVGDRVTAGEVIGEVGTTGNSTGNHLHFEIRTNYGDAHFNPNSYVPFPEVKEDPSP
ncbi:MAG: SH3 domain-containing protein [Turneriella sp.]